MNTARRIASGGRGQVFSKDPRASGRYLRNPATRRRGEDDSQTGGPDDPDDPELDKSYSWGELGDGLDLAGDLLGRGDRGAGLDQMASVAHRDQIDERMDFARYQEGPMRLGWLVNMHATSVMDIERNSVKSAVDYYFLEPDGRAFKCTLLYEPYFYIICREGTTGMVEEWVRRRFEKIERTERIEKEDLQMANHLTGRKRKLLKLVFRN
ncbi:DNA polymerase epsilon catalytic subunit, partial [Spiromyces aspiralis]